jgi:hypothetical protein
MQQLGSRRAYPELRELMVEASRALACLDAERLEELALCCRALNRDGPPTGEKERLALSRQAREGKQDLAVLGRVLEVTRANLNVMRRLRDLRLGLLEYGNPQATNCARTESPHGDN